MSFNRGTKAVITAMVGVALAAQASHTFALTVPAYNSLPGAPATLFLDFDGVDFGTTPWIDFPYFPVPVLPGLQPAYSVDGNLAEFSATELSNIEEVWSRVAEAFSPFNINVSTVDPGNYNRKESAHMAISGDGNWYGFGDGVAYRGGFALESPSQIPTMSFGTGWVFEDSFTSPQSIALAAIHEAGHLFGLRHQGSYDANGDVAAEYDNNSISGTRAPVMGSPYNAERGLWSIGPHNHNFYYEGIVNEMDVIGAVGEPTSNDFGMIDDEVGVSFETAPSISLSSTPLRGVIGNVTSGLASDDIDYYELTLGTESEVQIMIDVAEYGPGLDSKLLLFEEGNPTAFFSNDPALTTDRSSLQSSYTGTLAAGTYYIGVTSHGGYTYQTGLYERFLQDVGQYYISGSVTSLVPEPTSALLLAMAMIGFNASRRRGALRSSEEV